MFVLSILRDSVRVAPETFDRDLLEVLAEDLDKKYANKVLPELGLCICTYDFKDVEDAVIYPADGAAHHKVVFRMLMFRPFVGEVVVGTIIASNEDGIQVSLDFFDDMFIPSYCLPQPAEYDPRAKLWVWRFDEGEEGGVFTLHEQIRCRVDSITYTSITNTDKGRQATKTSTENSATAAKLTPMQSSSSAPDAEVPLVRQRSTSVDLSADDTSKDPPAMHIKGSVNDDGLGLVIWNWE